MENHLPALIGDLAIILGAGIIITLIFKKIKQPLILGYVIAGFLVGPYVTFIPTVSERESIKIWADIGVIFLLFNLGLEFSFKKLLQVGGTASITALVEIVFMLILGYSAGQLMGWNMINSLFLGGLLVASSTTIILRAFEELGVKRKNYAQVVFGVLVIEDIVVILLLVLLPTIALGHNLNGGDLLFSLLKLIFFLALWFIFGIFLIPSFLRLGKNILDEETLLILTVALCLGMVVLATKVGFSAELGAFVMGSILAETTSATKLENLHKPLKNLFGAIFFISIGMMIDPVLFYEYKWEILFVALIVIFGKSFFITLGAILSGQTLKQSIQVGMSMALIGEFAFIVAALGKSLEVTGEFLFPIAVGVVIITTFTTPYMIQYSESFYNIIVQYIPKKVLKSIDNYSKGSQNIRSENKWRELTRSVSVLIFTNGIVVIGNILLIIYLVLPFLQNKFSDFDIAKVICLIGTLLICAPFLWAILVKKPKSGVFRAIWNENIYFRGPLIVLEVSRIIVVILLLAFLFNSFYSRVIISLITIPIVILILYLLSTKFKLFYLYIQKKFLFNLNEKELKEQNTKANIDKKRRGKLLPWDNHLTNFEIESNAGYAGKTISELQWKEKFGINIAYIKRGDHVIPIPSGRDQVFPFDELGILGTDEQLKDFENLIGSEEYPIEKQLDVESIELLNFPISDDSFLISKTVDYLVSSVRGMVVGLERNDVRILNPQSETVFMEGDLVWIVGDKREIKEFINKE